MDIPFVWRLAMLLAVAAGASWIDHGRRGQKATAGREYGFILLTGAIGALIGAVNDAITSSVSPDYFVAGKGLADGDHLRLAAIQYGAQVGCSGGVIAGAILVYFGRRESRTPPVAISWLCQQVWIPAVGAVAGAFIIPAIAAHLDPFQLAKGLNGVIAPGRVPGFIRVWWAHTGLYAGLLAGELILLRLVNRERRRLEAPAPVC